MCISTTPRNRAVVNSRPVVDVSQLLSSLDAKTLIKPAELDAFHLPPKKTANGKRHRHITVTHNYHDHSMDESADYQMEHPARGGVTTPFPLKLHEMLRLTSMECMDHIVSWQPHGRCFVVHKPKEFTALLPRFFKLSKLASFQRQLNLYGFQRLTRGKDRGGYYHELFLKDREFLAHSIVRIKVKGTGVRARSNPDQEPNFWSGLPWVNGHSSQQQDEPAQHQQVALNAEEQYRPLHYQSQLSQEDEDEILLAFGSKTFHFLDPYSAGVPTQKPSWRTSNADTRPLPPPPSSLLKTEATTTTLSSSEIDSLLLSQEEADVFFQDFDFPDLTQEGAALEDDRVFGNLLEQIIA